MAFMSREAFLKLAAENPWEAREAFYQAYYGARGNAAERERVFDYGLAVAVDMRELHTGAGETLIEDLLCFSQDAFHRAAQLADLSLKQFAGNKAAYWRIIKLRADAAMQPKRAPLASSRHSLRPMRG